MGERARLGDILLEAGEIDAAQLDAALRRQDETGRPLGLTLVAMGVLREETLVRTLSQQLALPMARLEGKRISAEVLELVPFDLAEKHRCFPLFVKEEGPARALYLGMDDASDLDAIEALREATGMAIRPVLVAPSEIEEALHRQYHALASARPEPLATPEQTPQPAASDGLPPPPSDPGFDGTGLPADLEVDADALSGSDVDFDSQGLEPAADEAAADVQEPDWAAEPELGAADDLDVDLDVDSGLDLGLEPDPEPPPPDLDQGPDFPEDSLADFAPELAADAPGPPPLSHKATPQAAGPEPVSRDAILRALTQLLVEKGLIDREELIARVHRENGGGS
jgi:hypothetical protein